jgi:hypothetical protein
MFHVELSKQAAYSSSQMAVFHVEHPEQDAGSQRAWFWRWAGKQPDPGEKLEI